MQCFIWNSIAINCNKVSNEIAFHNKMIFFFFFTSICISSLYFARSDFARVRELFTRFADTRDTRPWSAVIHVKTYYEWPIAWANRPSCSSRFPKEKEGTRDVSERELIELCISVHVTCDQSWHARIRHCVEFACRIGAFFSEKPQNKH